MSEPFNAPVLVDPSGQPARSPRSMSCPKCAAPAERRVLSAGFGEPHDICGVCGHEFFGERTR